MTTKRPLTSLQCSSPIDDNSPRRHFSGFSNLIQPVIVKRSIINPDPLSSPPPLFEPISYIDPYRRRRRWASQHQNDNKVIDLACRVHFCPTVTIKGIPARDDYSESERKNLWSSLEEMKENALRNDAEFMFDGRDWRFATEEDGMHFDKVTGTLVHPVHAVTAYMLNGGEWKPLVKDNEQTHYCEYRRHDLGYFPSFLFARKISCMDEEVPVYL